MAQEEKLDVICVISSLLSLCWHSYSKQFDSVAFLLSSFAIKSTCHEFWALCQTWFTLECTPSTFIYITYRTTVKKDLSQISVYVVCIIYIYNHFHIFITILQTENIRRRHNYLPFIVELLKTLASQGTLVDLVSEVKLWLWYFA